MRVCRNFAPRGSDSVSGSRRPADADARVGCLGLHSAGHHAVLALVFGDQGVVEPGAQPMEREGPGSVRLGEVDPAAGRPADAQPHHGIRHGTAFFVEDSPRDPRAGRRRRVDVPRIFALRQARPRHGRDRRHRLSVDGGHRLGVRRSARRNHPVWLHPTKPQQQSPRTQTPHLGMRISG